MPKKKARITSKVRAEIGDWAKYRTITLDELRDLVNVTAGWDGKAEVRHTTVMSCNVIAVVAEERIR